MSQVIIVSNRLPISVKKEAGKLVFYRSIGGPATGLSSYIDDPKNRWIGWPGIASDELTAADKQAVVDELAKHNCSPVFLSKRQIDGFYNGYSNAVLWPVFHNLKRRSTPEETLSSWWRIYRGVNEEYAQAALSLIETGVRVWIHDYQLLLVPELLRAERADIISGFFLHIPFPPAKVFTGIAEHKKLLRGVLSADVVGFHTAGYVANFLEACVTDGVATAVGNELMVDERRMVRVADFPMGIDYAKYAAATKSKTVKAAVRRYRKRYRGLRVIVAVDRLDPTKGLVERLRAYATLLERHPRLRGKVVFSMVAAPSRTDIPAYQQLSKKLSSLVSEINAEYGTPKWQPIDYMNVAQPFEEVTALFQIADVAFIAPLRDGMNLAAKEFVASKHKSGVLILSETAGAAEELQDALLVNPKRPETLVSALEQALQMRKRELRLRLRRMQRQLSVNTVQAWAQGFVSTLQQPVPVANKLIVQTLRGKLQARLINDWKQARKRLLFLDYDGSLVPFKEDYKAAEPPKSLLGLLEKLSAGKSDDVVLISGRSLADLEKWFGGLPLNLVAEHGASIKLAGHKTWQTVEKVDTEWKLLLQPVLEKYAGLTPGARVEVKPHSLVWHYRAASPYHAQKYAVIIKRVLKPVLKKYGLELIQGNKVLEIKNPKVNKGAVARHWLERDYDFILAIGDDATDEDLFGALPPAAYSVKVGRGRTLARYRLPSAKDTVAMLKKLV